RWVSEDSMTSRTSLTPAVTAESSTKRRPELCAIACASVVLPVPGGPHRMRDTAPCSAGEEASDTKGEPGGRRWVWPATSSRHRGSIRTAKGVDPENRPCAPLMPAMLCGAADTRSQGWRRRLVFSWQSRRVGGPLAGNRSNPKQDRVERERLRLYRARQGVHEHRVARRRRDNIIAMSVATAGLVGEVVSQVNFFRAG